MTQSEIDIIVPALVKKLESLPDKTSISLSELVRKTFACQAEYVEGEGWRLTLDNGISFYDSEHFDLMEPFEKAVHEAGYKICSEKDDWGGASDFPTISRISTSTPSITGKNNLS